jgi:hypothetical protein
MIDPRPLLLIDVDGVLNPFAARSCPAGFTEHKLAGYKVRLNPAHGAALTALHDEGLYELVWATTWEAQADSLIAARVGLPRGLPVIVFPKDDDYEGWTWKLPAVRAYAADRPLAWLDDDLGRDAEAWARDRSAAGITTVLIGPNPGTGLVAAHFERLRRILPDLTGG